MDRIERDIIRRKLADLEPIPDNTESIYEEQVGTYVTQARFCQKLYEKDNDEKMKRELQGYKDEFYKKLREFIKSGFEPVRKITIENLREFFDFEELDWSIGKNMDDVNNCNLSLRHREM